MDQRDGWSKYHLDFHMEEFRSLKTEVLQLGAEAEVLLRFVLVGDAAVVAWLLSPAPQNRALSLLSGWIPFLLTAFSAALAFTYRRRILLTRRYLLDLEKALAREGRGWGHYIQSMSLPRGAADPPSGPRTNLWTGRAIAVIWAIALASTLFFAVYWSCPLA